jgi:hypothetical protein
VSVTIQLALGGAPVPDALYTAIARLQIEESADEPGALLIQLPANRTAAGDLQFVGDGTLEPMTNVTLTVTAGAQGASPQCVFDGYVLSWRLALDRAGTASTIEAWAHDASWLMNLDDTVIEWAGQTDGEIANTIFGSYGFTPADSNTDNDSPSHTPDGHTVFQRGTDLQFLRGLARRAGKVCRVACADTPGQRTGYFAVPDLTQSPATTISLVDPASWTVDALVFDWDVMRPTEVNASQVDLSQASDTGSDTSADTGLVALDARDYPSYLGQSSALRLTTSADVSDLDQRTAAVLTETGFFARCTGEADAQRLGTILRAGDIVAIEGAGNLQSGNWLVWNVRHTYTPDTWTMSFTLVRNAIGPPATGGGLGSLAGAVAGALGGAL